MRRLGNTARGLGAAIIAAVGLLAPTARAQEAAASCTATLTGRRVVVRPEAQAFLTEDLDRLLRLGLAGRLEVELTLLRRRKLWFDARVDSTRAPAPPVTTSTVIRVVAGARHPAWVHVASTTAAAAAPGVAGGPAART